MTAPGTLLLRADASTAIGAGHVMRCLALAQEWAGRGGTAVFASRELDGMARDRVVDEGFERVAVGARATTRDAANAVGAWAVVLDVGPGVRDELAALAAHRTCVIDDSGVAFDETPSLVVNQNAHGPATPYTGVASQAVLTGLDYVMLRDEFLAVRPNPRRSDEAADILLALGGTDPLGLLPALSNAVLDAVAATIHVAVSSRHPALAQLEQLAARNARLRLHVDTRDMPRVMAGVDLAVTAGGTAVWELAYMGVPALVGTVSEVEQRLVDGLRALGLYRVLGDFAALSAVAIAIAAADASADPAWRRATSDAARRVIDGQGRRRVVDALLEVSQA